MVFVSTSTRHRQKTRPRLLRQQLRNIFRDVFYNGVCAAAGWGGLQLCLNKATKPICLLLLASCLSCRIRSTRTRASFFVFRVLAAWLVLVPFLAPEPAAAQHYAPAVRVPYNLYRDAGEGTRKASPTTRRRSRASYCSELGPPNVQHFFRSHPSYHREVSPLAVLFGHTLPVHSPPNATATPGAAQQMLLQPTASKSLSLSSTVQIEEKEVAADHAGPREIFTTTEQEQNARDPQGPAADALARWRKQVELLRLAFRYATEAGKAHDGFLLFGLGCGIFELFFPCATDERMLRVDEIEDPWPDHHHTAMLKRHAEAKAELALLRGQYKKLLQRLADTCEASMRNRFVHTADRECRDAFPLGGELPDESARFGPRAGRQPIPVLKELFVEYRENSTMSIRALSYQKDHNHWGDKRVSEKLSHLFAEVVGTFFPKQKGGNPQLGNTRVKNTGAGVEAPIIFGGARLYPAAIRGFGAEHAVEESGGSKITSTSAAAGWKDSKGTSKGAKASATTTEDATPQEPRTLEEVDEASWWGLVAKLHSYSCAMYYAFQVQSAFVRDVIPSTFAGIRNFTSSAGADEGSPSTASSSSSPASPTQMWSPLWSTSSAVDDNDDTDGESSLRDSLATPGPQPQRPSTARPKHKSAQIDQWDPATGHALADTRRGTAQREAERCSFGLVRWWHTTIWSERRGEGEEQFRTLLEGTKSIETHWRVAGHPTMAQVRDLVLGRTPMLVPLLFRLQSGVCAAWQAEKTSATLMERRKELDTDAAVRTVGRSAYSVRNLMLPELVRPQTDDGNAESESYSDSRTALGVVPARHDDAPSRPRVRLLMVVWRAADVLRYLRNIQLWQCYAEKQNYEFVLQALPPKFLEIPPAEKMTYYANLTTWVKDDEIFGVREDESNSTRRFARIRRALNVRRKRLASGREQQRPVQVLGRADVDEASPGGGVDVEHQQEGDESRNSVLGAESFALLKRWRTRDRGGEELAKQPWFRLRWWRMREHLLKNSVDPVDILITVDVDTLPNPACLSDVALHRLVDRHDIAIKDTPPFSEVNTGGLMVVRNSVWSRMYLEELCETLQQLYFTPAQHPDMVSTTEAVLHVLRVEVLAKLQKLLTFVSDDELLAGDNSELLAQVDEGEGGVVVEPESEDFGSAGSDSSISALLTSTSEDEMSDEGGNYSNDQQPPRTFAVRLTAGEAAALKQNAENIVRRIDLSHCWRSYNTALRSQVNAAKCWNEQVDGMLRILKLLPKFNSRGRAMIVAALKNLSYGPQYNSVGSLGGELRRDYEHELSGGPVPDGSSAEEAAASGPGLAHLVSTELKERVLAVSFPDSVRWNHVRKEREAAAPGNHPLRARASAEADESRGPHSAATDAGNDGREAGTSTTNLEKEEPSTPVAALSPAQRDAALRFWPVAKRNQYLQESTYRFQHWLYYSVEVGIPSFRQKSLSEVVHFVDPRKLEMNFRPTQFGYMPPAVVEKLDEGGVRHPGRIAEVHVGFTPFVAHWAGLRWGEKMASMFWYLKRFNGTEALLAAVAEQTQSAKTRSTASTPNTIPWYDYDGLHAGKMFNASLFENYDHAATCPLSPSSRTACGSGLDNMGKQLFEAYNGREVCAWADATAEKSVCQPGTPYHRLLMCRGAGEWLCG